MSKAELIQSLEAYSPADELETEHQFNILNFLRTESHCYERRNLKGHLTASSLILNHTRDMALMLHHAKLQIWLQPGGHADGETDLLGVAMKEAREETGIPSFKVLSKDIFDIDMHLIPLHKQVPAHYHLDIRFLLETDSSIPLISNHESNQLAWIPLTEMNSYNKDESVLRMVRKVSQM